MATYIQKAVPNESGGSCNIHSQLGGGGGGLGVGLLGFEVWGLGLGVPTKA